MEINFHQKFYREDGKTTIEYVEGRKFDATTTPPTFLEDGPPLSLGILLMDRMLNAVKDEKGNDLTDGKVKFRYFTLAAIIRDSMKPGAKRPNFNVEDLALFKGLLGSYMPLLVGQAWSMLEGNGNPLVEKPEAEPEEAAPACPACGGVDGHRPDCVAFAAQKEAVISSIKKDHPDLLAMPVLAQNDQSGAGVVRVNPNIGPIPVG